jgi:hypothetical protein
MAGTSIFSARTEPGELALARKTFTLSLVITGIYLLVGFKWFFVLAWGSWLDAWQLAFAWPLYRYGIVACLLYLVPWYAWTKRWGMNASNLGWRRGNTRLGAILTAIGLAVAVVAGFTAAADASMVAWYPWERVFVDPSFGSFNIAGFIVMEAMYVILYYMPYEFFFRGFSMVPLVEHGKVRSTWTVIYSTAITTLVHWDVPATELVSALVVGLIFGIAVLKCRSIWYVLIVHVVVGVMTNIMCVLVLQGIM